MTVIDLQNARFRENVSALEKIMRSYENPRTMGEDFCAFNREPPGPMQITICRPHELFRAMAELKEKYIGLRYQLQGDRMTIKGSYAIYGRRK